MTDTRIYLGRVGQLAALRSPRGNVETTRQRRTSAFELGVGGAAIDQMIGGARTYTLNYEMLTIADFTTLQAYHDGHEGPGPFVLLDPAQRNMLPANIAGATSVTNSTDGGPAGSFQLLGLDEDFNRSPVASGWGTAPTGQVWAVGGAGSAGDFSTIVGAGLQNLTTTNAFRNSLIDIGTTDFDITVDFSINVGSPTGAAITQWICGRLADANNYYVAQINISTGGNFSLSILRRSGGTLSGALGTGAYVAGTGHQSGSIWRMHFTGTGTSLAASVWLRDSASEPSTPQVTATDATLTTGTQLGLLSRLETGNTNVGVVSTWYQVIASPSYATLTSSTAYTDAGPRVLAMNFSAAPSGSAVIGIDWPSSIFSYGVPVVAGRALCFSAYVRGGGTDSVTTWTPRIVWRDSTGAIVSSTSSGSGAVTSSAGAWAQLYATGTPPATAVFADLQITYTSGATAGAVAYFRRFMLNEGTTPDTIWTAGTGVWPVRPLGLADVWPFLSPELRAQPVAVFVEDVS